MSIITSIPAYHREHACYDVSYELLYRYIPPLQRCMEYCMYIVHIRRCLDIMIMHVSDDMSTSLDAWNHVLMDARVNEYTA